VSQTLVYLVRHTEPELPDHRKRFVGWIDPPLSPTGIGQAHAVADRLRAVRFDSIWSSDLRRSVATADIIIADLARAARQERAATREPAAQFERRLPPGAGSEPVPQVRVDAGLREINAGLWEGLSFEEAAARYPEEAAERERDPVGFRFPAGESFRDLRDRVLPAFSKIVGEDGGAMLVVSHLGVIRVLLCEFLYLPLEKLFSIGQAYGHVNLIAVTVKQDGSRRIEVIPSPGAWSSPGPAP
jgi:alpha-ribazole phosphatase